MLTHREQAIFEVGCAPVLSTPIITPFWSWCAGRRCTPYRGWNDLCLVGCAPVLCAPMNEIVIVLVRRKALRTLRGMKLFMFGRVCSGVERTNEW